MANVNKVILIGNLTRDPELRYTPNGTAVAEFGLAVNRQWRGADGNQNEETCFVDIVVWGRQAEVANEYLNKGRQAYIEGRLQFDQWETQDGQKRSKLKVVCERLQLLGSRGDTGAPPSVNPEPPGQSSEPAPAPASTPPQQTEAEDDIPF